MKGLYVDLEDKIDNDDIDTLIGAICLLKDVFSVQYVENIKDIVIRKEVINGTKES